MTNDKTIQTLNQLIIDQLVEYCSNKYSHIGYGDIQHDPNSFGYLINVGIGDRIWMAKINSSIINAKTDEDLLEDCKQAIDLFYSKLEKHLQDNK